MELKKDKSKTFTVSKGKCDVCSGNGGGEWMTCWKCEGNGYLELTAYEWDIIDLKYELKEANSKIARYERALKDIASPTSTLYDAEYSQNIARLALK